MPTLKLVTFDADPEDILHAKLNKIREDPKAVAIYHRPLHDLCTAHKGIGLAANQAGLKHNLFYIGPDARISKSVIGELCINPRYTPQEHTLMTEHREGCLSIPGALFKVKRYAVIHAEWYNAAGHFQKRRLTGLAAEVFQHEYDHLCGITLLESGEVTVAPQHASS